MAEFTEQDAKLLGLGANDVSAADPLTAAEAGPNPEEPGPDAAPAAASGAGKASGPRPRMPLGQLLWIIGGVIAVLALGVAGIVTWKVTTATKNVVEQVAGTKIAKNPNDPAQMTFTDSGTRFRLSFPASWSTQDVGGADVRLLAGPGGGDLMSIRVVTLNTGSSSAPTPSSLRPYLDTIVQEPTVKIVQRAQIVMDKLPGWYYVYTFTDSATRKAGVHAQYFIIRGSRLYSIVFQALPGSDFSKLAPVYQKVANSIQFF